MKAAIPIGKQQKIAITEYMIIPVKLLEPPYQRAVPTLLWVTTVTLVAGGAWGVV